MTTRRRKPNALRQAAELAVAAPQVVALRGARILAAGTSPDARDRHEIWRMGAEKMQAMGECMNAIALQMYRAQQEWALLAMRQWWAMWMNPWQWFGWWQAPLRSSAMQKRLRSDVAKAWASGLAPVHKRATANARRLSRPAKR